MSILDWFRPRWRHSDPEVRADAVRTLGEDGRNDLLAKVAFADPEPKVRRLAIKRLDDPALLSRLADQDADDGLRRLAADRANEILIAGALAGTDEAKCRAALDQLRGQKAIAQVAKRAAHAGLRAAALGRLTDEDEIADVARNAEEPLLRQQALAKVDGEEILFDLALLEPVREVALAALARIRSTDSLEQLARRAKSKALRVAAEQRLGRRQAPARPADDRPVKSLRRRRPEEVSPEARRRARMGQLCIAVEELAGSSDWDHTQARLEALESQWAGEFPGLSADDEHGRRFRRARERFAQRRRAHLQAIAAQVAAEEGKAAAEAKREAELAERKRRAEEEHSRRLAERAERDQERNAERDKRDQEKNAEREQQRLEREKRDQERAAERARKAEERTRNQARADELATRLEGLAESADRKAIDQAIKETQTELATLGAVERERYNAARGRLLAKQQEARDTEDWKRWANVPKLEELVAAAEILASAEEVETSHLVADLKMLQGEWKRVGPAPKEKSEQLWARFKAAGDKVFARAQEHFAVQDSERGENLKAKEELCAKVEALADSTDWKATAEAIKKLQEEWKRIGPVPKEQTEAIWTRFRGACDRFFDRRKVDFAKRDEDRGESLKQLEALCLRVEALAESSDWKATAEKIKAAQADWKAVGPVGRKQSDELWKRFRGACDRFFERRQAEFARIDEQREANLKIKLALCEAAEKAEPGPDQDPIDLIRKYMGEWKAVGPVPKAKADAIWDRFRRACDQLRDGGGPGEAPAPEPQQANWPRFENRLPLGNLASEWERLAQADHAAESAMPHPGPEAEAVSRPPGEDEPSAAKLQMAPAGDPAKPAAVDDLADEWSRLADQ